MKKMFEVWSEGYAATGESSGATFHGKTMAETFDEACIKLVGKDLDTDESEKDGYNRTSNGKMSIWGCELFDNEKDARASFG
jgi:hypothetical protein